MGMMVLGVPFDLLMVSSNFHGFGVAWSMLHGLPLGSLPKVAYRIFVLRCDAIAKQWGFPGEE